MNTRLLLSCLTVALTCSSPLLAEAPPLSRAELARCASQVQTLRHDAPRLTRTSIEYDQQRLAINRRSAELKTERDNVDPEDLERGLAIRQRLAEHRKRTLAFNARIEQLKRDLEAINALKQDYDRNCARRPYRRDDFEALPTDRQAAMRAGLAGVRVPYLDPDTPPSEHQD